MKCFWMVMVNNHTIIVMDISIVMTVIMAMNRRNEKCRYKE